MVATQQVREEIWYESFKQGWLTRGVWLAASSGYNYTKNFKISKQNSNASKQDLEHTAKSIAEDRPKQQDQPGLTLPNQPEFY
jgi:hypothetical protein